VKSEKRERTKGENWVVRIWGSIVMSRKKKKVCAQGGTASEITTQNESVD
jgi:hypothetical protein